MKSNKNIWTTRPIFENVPVSKLKDPEYQDCIIIYSQNNLNEELDQIIELYNVIPSVRNQKFSVTSIKVSPRFKAKTNCLSKNLLLVVDPNDTNKISYREIRELCNKHKIPFKNQSFSQLIKQIRENFFGQKTKRQVFTKKKEKNCSQRSEECATTARSGSTLSRWRLITWLLWLTGGNQRGPQLASALQTLPP